ncbi:MAG: hypothetical protein KatS3mg073_1417 [Meiothermus sp.]|nr:MAG: hypothetical protein KatS3mg073_1417 [Meiothermus sp.]
MNGQEKSEKIPPDHILEAWKEAQRTQTHFNDLLMRIRNFAFLIAAAVVGAATSLAPRQQLDDFTQIGWLFIGAIVPWVSLYILDRYYYHVLLIGAVKYAEKIEQEYPILGLSTSITELNRSNKVLLASTGRSKVSVFYGLPFIALAAFGTYFLTNTLGTAILVGFAVLFLVICEVQRGSVGKDINDKQASFF